MDEELLKARRPDFRVDQHRRGHYVSTMKIPAMILLALALALSSCTERPAIPRSEALLIAGELVARQRLDRAKAENSDNEPDLLVTDVLAVEGCDNLAVAVCEYYGLGQGYAFLVRRHKFPPETLVVFGGGQYEKVKSVTSRRTSDGTVITVSHITLHGNHAGTEELLVRTDGSLQWLKRNRR